MFGRMVSAPLVCMCPRTDVVHVFPAEQVVLA